MQIDATRPKKIYRYSEAKWLERSLRLGEFRLRPASDYKKYESDPARQDDELVRLQSSPGDKVQITFPSTGKSMSPVGDVTYRAEVGSNYLTLCFSDRYDPMMYEDFPGTDACLAVHNVEEFSERLHVAVEAALPDWAGMDGRVIYGGPSPLGAVFSKPVRYVTQHEWRFAWRPPIEVFDVPELFISIGSIEHIAEVIRRPPHT